MIKSRTAQLVYLSMAVAIGLIGLAACVGLFQYKFSWDFYIHFTNISNIFCVGVLIVELIQTIRKKEDSYISACPTLKLCGVLAILMTFVVFNFMLAPTREMYRNFTINSISLHVLIPILFIADWFLFYERGKLSWKTPLASVLFPFTYMVFVYVHAAAWGFDASIKNMGGVDPLIYPYFFLNLETYGVDGVALWMLAFLVVFVSVGFIFFGLDKLIKSPKTKLQS